MRWLTRSFVALVVALLPACNTLTGANDIEIVDEGDEPGGPAAPTPTVPGAPPTSTTPPGDPGPGDPIPQTPIDATGVVVEEIAIYQGVKRTLMDDGSPVSGGVPVVAGRDALVRVFVETTAEYAGQVVTARLLVDAEPALEISKAIDGASSDASLGSTFNFELPGAMVGPSSSYRVELVQPAGTGPGANPAAHFPAAGQQPFGAGGGATLKVIAVPIAYAADGSNRLPDTSAGQLEAIRDAFYAMYPVANVEISKRASVSWSGDVYANGNGWEELLSALVELRSSDGAPADEYYYGMFSPASSLQSFCGGGCVAGLGFVGGPTDSFARSAIGLGFPGETAVGTAVHEVGHNHGRLHAPCGPVSGADPSFPHNGGSIGAWGYDLRSGSLIAPSSAADIMGYCNPAWVSDYTFGALFDRLEFLSGADLQIAPELLDRTYDRILVGTGRADRWLSPIELHEPPMGEPRAVEIDTVGGTVEVTASWHPFDHVEGGLLLVPRTARSLGVARVAHEGHVVEIVQVADAAQGKLEALAP